jgi:hypothetical protein
MQKIPIPPLLPRLFSFQLSQCNPGVHSYEVNLSKCLCAVSFPQHQLRGDSAAAAIEEALVSWLVSQVTLRRKRLRRSDRANELVRRPRCADPCHPPSSSTRCVCPAGLLRPRGPHQCEPLARWTRHPAQRMTMTPCQAHLFSSRRRKHLVLQGVGGGPTTEEGPQQSGSPSQAVMTMTSLSRLHLRHKSLPSTQRELAYLGPHRSCHHTTPSNDRTPTPPPTPTRTTTARTTASLSLVE